MQKSHGLFLGDDLGYDSMYMYSTVHETIMSAILIPLPMKALANGSLHKKLTLVPLILQIQHCLFKGKRMS